MKEKNKVLILGAGGMVGEEISSQLSANTDCLLLTPSRLQLNLESQREVEAYFDNHCIKHVYFCAASAWSIDVMEKKAFSILQKNLLMQQNVISSAYKCGIEKMIFFSSSCIYPEDEPRVMQEKDIMSGVLPVAQRAYGLSKVAGTMLCQSYNRQYRTEYISLVPCGIYGGRRSFENDSPQVIPALIKRMEDAIRNKQEVFTVWGSGTPVREFVHVADVAKAAIMIMEKEKLSFDTYNVGSGNHVTVAQLAYLIASLMNYQGRIVFDQSKADGAKFKILNSERLRAEGWEPTIDLMTGLKRSVEIFKALPH